MPAAAPQNSARIGWMWSAMMLAESRPTMNRVSQNASLALRSEDRCTRASITVTVPDPEPGFQERPERHPRLDLDTTSPPCEGFMGRRGGRPDCSQDRPLAELPFGGNTCRVAATRDAVTPSRNCAGQTADGRSALASATNKPQGQT